MVLTVKFWIENTDMVDSLFLILKISNVAYQLNFFKVKKKKKKLKF